MEKGSISLSRSDVTFGKVDDNVDSDATIVL